MADILFDAQSSPSTPASGKAIAFVDVNTEKLMLLDDGGLVNGLLSRNYSTASQGAGFASDTYVTNSGLLIPSVGLQAGMIFQWIITASKTAAGTAAAVYTIRVGAAQTTGDTSILALTAGAQTAAADQGMLIVRAHLRNSGAAAVLAGAAAWAKTQTGITGLGGSMDGVGSSFDSTGRAGQFVGLSINGGASAAWTVTAVQASMIAG